jgi:hypothetical protein
MAPSSGENQNGPPLREERILWLQHIKKTPTALVGHSIRANRAVNPHTRLDTTNQVPGQKKARFWKAQRKATRVLVEKKEDMLYISGICISKYLTSKFYEQNLESSGGGE